MQAALLRAGLFPPPASGTEILPGFDSASAWCTPDAGVATIVKRVIRNVVLFNVCPHVIQCPVQQWAEFVKAVAFIPFLNLQRLPGIGLFPPESGNPRLFPGQSAGEWNDFPDIAALFSLRHAAVKPVCAVQRHPFLDHRGIGAVDLDRDRVGVPNLVQKRMGFVGKTSGIERKHLNPRGLLRNEVQQYHVFEPEAAGEGAGSLAGFDFLQEFDDALDLFRVHKRAQVNP